MADHVKKSRFLSWALRHAPEKIGLELDAAGWAQVSQLIDCAAHHGVQLTRSLIEEIVESDEKGRYHLSPDGHLIRAVYGHSISVDLQLRAEEPPEILYHGTATRSLDSIMKNGLSPRRRLFVHLSITQEAALAIGRRHGRPIVLGVESGTMFALGHEFFRSAKEIWLVRSVPREFVRVLGAPA